MVLDQYCIEIFISGMENKELNHIVMTVAFPHCCAPTVGHSYIYRRRGFILTLFGDTQTLTSHFGSPPSNRKLWVRRVSANRNLATEWKESRINAERWAALHFGQRTNRYNSAHNPPTQQLNNAASLPSSSVWLQWSSHALCRFLMLQKSSWNRVICKFLFQIVLVHSLY